MPPSIEGQRKDPRLELQQRFERFSRDYLAAVDAFGKVFTMRYDSGLVGGESTPPEHAPTIATQQLKEHLEVMHGLRDSLAGIQLEGARLQGMAHALREEARAGDLMILLGHLQNLLEMCDTDNEVTAQLHMVSVLSVYLEPNEAEAQTLPSSPEEKKAWDMEEQMRSILEEAQDKVAELHSIYGEMLNAQKYSLYILDFIGYQDTRLNIALAQYESHLATKQ